MIALYAIEERPKPIANDGPLCGTDGFFRKILLLMSQARCFSIILAEVRGRNALKWAKDRITLA